VKSFAVSASTPAKKMAWMEAVEHACRQLEREAMDKERKNMVQDAGGGGGGGGGGARKKEKGRRISMINRFETGLQQSHREEETLSRSSRKQSGIVDGALLGATMGGGAVEEVKEVKEVKELVGEEKTVEPAKKEGVGARTEDYGAKVLSKMSDADILVKFQHGLKYSKSILEGSHPVSDGWVVGWLGGLFRVVQGACADVFVCFSFFVGRHMSPRTKKNCCFTAFSNKPRWAIV